MTEERRSPKKRGATWSSVCKLAMSLPGMEQGTSYGTPSLHVRKKFIARLKEDGETVAMRVDLFERDLLLELDPAAFYLTDHYRPYPAMLIRLGKVRLDLLWELLVEAWRRQAPKKLVAAGLSDRDGEAIVAPARSLGRKVKRK